MQTESPPDLGFATRVRDTFLAPAKLAHEIRHAGPWLDVLLVSTAIAIVSVILMPDEVFTESMREPVTRRGEPVEITSSPQVIAAWGRGMGILATIATHPLIAFTLAGILTLVFSILGRGRASFRDYLSLSAHALLIPALGTLIAIIIRLVTGAATGSIGVTAFFGPADASSLAVATLAAIDPFIVWMMVMVAYGVHALDPRYRRGGAVLLLVGGYVLFVLASTALLHPELRGGAEVEALTGR